MIGGWRHVLLFVGKHLLVGPPSYEWRHQFADLRLIQARNIVDACVRVFASANLEGCVSGLLHLSRFESLTLSRGPEGTEGTHQQSKPSAE